MGNVVSFLACNIRISVYTKLIICSFNYFKSDAL